MDWVGQCVWNYSGDTPFSVVSAWDVDVCEARADVLSCVLVCVCAPPHLFGNRMREWNVGWGGGSGGVSGVSGGGVNGGVSGDVSGGSGGGGGCATAGASSMTAGGGGASGSYVDSDLFTAPATSVPVVVGVGGAGGVGASNGTSGGSSSFGSYISCVGGAPGGAGANGAGNTQGGGVTLLPTTTVNTIISSAGSAPTDSAAEQ